VIPAGMAIYRWQGELYSEPQAQLIIKTRRAAWPSLHARILARHSDETPEILALPVADGSPAYLAWLDESVVGDIQGSMAAGWRDYRDVYPEGEHTVAGTIKVLRDVESPQLGNRRDLLVYLPPSYSRSDRRYPVIYMHDGQNLFDATTSYAGEWQVDETLEALSVEGLEAIVVGIPNMGERRAHEYIPFPEPDLDEVQGALYVAFIVETVKPLIDRDFRTRSDRASTGVMGSSLGGLISLYAFFRYPDVFGLAGVVSPAFRAGQGGIFPFVKDAAVTPGRIYMDVGTAEGPFKGRPQKAFARRYLADVQRMQYQLLRKGYRAGRDLLYVEDEGGIHHESAWTRRLPDALRFLLS